MYHGRGAGGHTEIGLVATLTWGEGVALPKTGPGGGQVGNLGRRGSTKKRDH